MRNSTGIVSEGSLHKHPIPIRNIMNVSCKIKQQKKKKNTYIWYDKHVDVCIVEVMVTKGNIGADFCGIQSGITSQGRDEILVI